MYIKKTTRKSGSVAIRIVESFREWGKVKQRTVRYLGSGKTKTEVHQLENEARRLIASFKEQNPALPGMEKEVNGLKTRKNLKKPARPSSRIPFLLETSENNRVIQGIKGVGGALYDQLGFQHIIQGDHKDKEWNKYLKTLVLAHITNPLPKRKTDETLIENDSQKIPLKSVYRMMDHLVCNIHRVKKVVSDNILSLFKQQVDTLFFNVITLYFKSVNSDSLNEYDRFKDVQAVLALVTNFEGHPLSYELFHGNVSEGQELISYVENLRKFYSAKSAVLVSDRAMFSEKNLEFMGKSGLDYMVPAKIQKEKILNSDLNLKEQEKKESSSILNSEHRGKGLILNWSSKRTEKNAKDREYLIDCLMKKVKKGRFPIKSLISNNRTKKRIQIRGDSDVSLTEEKIRVIRALFYHYRELWKIGDAFEADDESSLCMQAPIYHWTPKRIKAHIAICFLAYSLSYTLKNRLETSDLDLSVNEIKDALKRDQYSIIEDKRTGQKYRSPSKHTESIEQIYSAIGVKRISVVTPID